MTSSTLYLVQRGGGVSLPNVLRSQKVFLTELWNERRLNGLEVCAHAGNEY